MRTIKCNELYNKLINGENIVIIDIRDENIYNAGHIPSSINIPYDKLSEHIYKYLNFSLSYYIICDYGITSPKATKELNDLGLFAVNVLGGYKEWTFPLAF